MSLFTDQNGDIVIIIMMILNYSIFVAKGSGETMTADRIIELLQEISADQYDTPAGRERREALDRAVEALKYLERTKLELERRMFDVH